MPAMTVQALKDILDQLNPNTFVYLETGGLFEYVDHIEVGRIPADRPLVYSDDEIAMDDILIIGTGARNSHVQDRRVYLD